MQKTKKILIGFAAAASVVTAGGGVYLHDQARHTPLTQCLAGNTPRASGAPVIVIPGFANNDTYMSAMHTRLRENGYTVYGWNAGVNTGPNAQSFAALTQQLQTVYQTHHQKVILVGYSFGGVYARELARTNPDMVDSVVTLGAPFALASQSGTPDPKISALYQIAHGKTPTVQDLQTAPPVATLSLYSKNDRIVPWQASQTLGSAQSYNLEITHGHLAMPFNLEAAAITSAWITNRDAALKRCGLKFAS